MIRKVLKDFKFSDGTVVRKGQMLAVASRPAHHDERLYPRADTFDGFRFYDENEPDTADELSLPNRLISTSTDFVAFGTGRHAWYVCVCICVSVGLYLIQPRAILGRERVKGHAGVCGSQL